MSKPHWEEYYEDPHLPEPAVDNVPVTSLLWGVIALGFVLTTVFALGGYFWLERRAEDVPKVAQVSSEGSELQKLRELETKLLAGGQKTAAGKTTLAIGEAMKTVLQQQQNGVR